MFTVPEEVLRLIFANLDLKDLKQCQLVCQQWYRPARVQFLQDITLTSVFSIQKFLEIMTRKTSKVFLNAVQTMTICSLSDNPNFGQRRVTKLILQFPNLKSINIDNQMFSANLLDNDDIKSQLAEKCPKLENVELNVDPDHNLQYYGFLYNLRRSLNVVHLTETIHLPRACKSLIDYLTSFPKLQRIGGEHNLDRFEEILELVDVLPDFNCISSGDIFDDNNLALNYLLSKPVQEQNRFKQRLTEIRKINCLYTDNLCINTVQFIQQYMTGLEDFEFNGMDCMSWNDAQMNAFCTNVLSSAFSARHSGNVFASNMNLLNFSPYYQQIVQKVFPINNNTFIESQSFHIRILGTTSSNTRLPLDIDVESTSIPSSTRALKLNITQPLTSPHILLDTFNSTPSLSHITVVNFYTRTTTSHSLLHQRMLKSLLSQTPNLHALSMIIPSMFNANHDLQVNTYLTHLILRARTSDAIHKHVVKNCLSMFPNAGSLQLLYYCGTWDEEFGAFQLDATGPSLKLLSLDLTAARNKNPLADFILIELCILKNNRRVLYDLAVDMTDIVYTSDAKLAKCKRGIEYTPMRVMVTSVEQLHLFAYTEEFVGQPQYGYKTDGISTFVIDME